MLHFFLRQTRQQTQKQLGNESSGSAFCNLTLCTCVYVHICLYVCIRMHIDATCMSANLRYACIYPGKY